MHSVKRGARVMHMRTHTHVHTAFFCRWPKKLASKHQWGPEEWRALREHLTSVMCSLCVHLGAGTVAQLRLWKKFDDEEAAVAQTVQMWSEHRSHLLRKGLMVGEAALEDADVAGDDGDDAELVLQRLSEGHIALTQLTIILVCLAALPSPLQQALRNKVSAAAKLASVRFGEVAALIHDHKRRTGDDYTTALDDLKDVFC